MKAITINQWKFAATTAVATVLFQWVLHHYISTAAITGVWLAALLFFMAMFVNGWYFGKRDAVDLPLAIAAFRFHLITFLVYNGISLLWQAITTGSISRSSWLSVTLWGAGLALHGVLFALGRNSRIKGIDKADIFE